MKRYLLQCDPNWKNYEREMGKQAKKPSPDAPVIFVDVSLGHWYGRSNWPALRKMMKATEGSVRAGSAGDVFLMCGDNDEVKVQLVNQTKGGVGPMFLQRARSSASFITSYAYSVDPAVLTPSERIYLFADVASKRGYLKSSLANELRQFASANTLIMFGVVFGILFGAEAVAGATAAYVIARSFGILTFIADYRFYNTEGRKLQALAQRAESPAEIDEGARILSKLLARLYSDIITNLGISSVSEFVTKMMRQISVTLFGHRAATVNHLDPPKDLDVADKLLKYKGIAQAYVKHNGYARGDLLKRSPLPDTLEPAAVKMFADSSVKNLEVILIRDPGKSRMARILSGITAVGKPMWLKAKSKNGIDGVICLSSVPKAGLKSSGQVDLSHLRGLSPALDKVIASNPKRPAYQFPTEVQANWKANKEIDYGSPSVKSGPDMNDSILVEIPVPNAGSGSGNKFLVLTKQKNPFIGDTDVASFHRPGTSQAGVHRQTKNRAAGQNPEDCVVLEAQMNRSYAKHGGNALHQPLMHGGYGASTKHVIASRRAGKGHWSPRDKTGKYDQEKLYVILPVAAGNTIRGECFELSGWRAAEQFFKANHFQWPF